MEINMKEAFQMKKDKAKIVIIDGTMELKFYVVSIAIFRFEEKW
jgi:hypothetical protein